MCMTMIEQQRYTNYQHVEGNFGIILDTNYNVWNVVIITGKDQDGLPAWFPYGSYSNPKSART